MLLRVADTPVVSSSRLAGWWRWAAVLVPGLLLYLLPLPDLNTVQRHLLAIFAATIVALVAQPVPMGASVVVAMTLLALTGTLPPAKVLSGFANITVWLIFTAFLFGRAFTVTGLGKRVGYLFVRRFARGPLSLGYSLAAADLVLAPFIPSDTARGGSVIFPVTRSVASALGSEPGPTAGRAGTYLILASFHTTYTASAMFLTSMAANPLIAEFMLAGFKDEGERAVRQSLRSGGKRAAGWSRGGRLRRRVRIFNRGLLPRLRFQLRLLDLFLLQRQGVLHGVGLRFGPQHRNFRLAFGLLHRANLVGLRL